MNLTNSHNFVELAQRTPTRIYCEANDESWRWDTRFVPMEDWNPWKSWQRLARRYLQAHNGIFRWIPQQASKVQIHARALPPKHLPVRNRVPFHFEWRRRLETLFDHPVNSVRNSRVAGQPKPQVTSPGRPVHAVHPEPRRVQQESVEAGRWARPKELSGKSGI